MNACVGLNLTSTTEIGTVDVNSAAPALPAVTGNKAASRFAV